MALVPIEEDIGDTAFDPQLGELPSPPRYHSEAELSKEDFTTKGLKAGLTKEKSKLIPIEETKPSSPVEKPLAITKGTIGDVKEIQQIHQEAKDVYEKLKGYFTRTEGHEFDIGQAGKQALGGGIAGAATGLAAPKALELAGKLIPGPAGKVVSGLGTAWGEMGAIQRVARGVLGGGAAGAAEEATSAAGLSPAEQTAVGLVAGGTGEAVASLPAKSAVLVGKLFGSMAVGSPSGISGATLGLMGPNRMAFKKSAELEKERLFGKKIPGYVEGLESNTNKEAAKSSLLKSDPTIPQNLEKPVSAYYRDDLLYPQVSNLILSGKRFSGSAPYRTLENKVYDLVDGGEITRKQSSDLLGALSTDRSRNPNVLKTFPERVDNIIREWGKQAEVGPQEGYKAVSQKLASSVRSDIRDSYNKWLDSQGLGPLEKKYRTAYSQEKIAEAKDMVPHLLKYGKSEELDRIGGAIMQDPSTKGVLLDETRKYLNNADVSEVISRYNAIDRLLVGNRLISAQEILPIRQAVAKIAQTAEHGEKVKLAERVKRLLIRAVPYQAGVITTKTREE